MPVFSVRGGYQITCDVQVSAGSKNNPDETKDCGWNDRGKVHGSVAAGEAALAIHRNVSHR